MRIQFHMSSKRFHLQLQKALSNDNDRRGIPLIYSVYQLTLTALKLEAKNLINLILLFTAITKSLPH